MAQAFLWAVAAFGAMLVLAGAGWTPLQAPDPVLAISLAVMAVVATQFPLMVSPRYKVDLSITVYFAAILLFAPGVAIILIYSSRLLAEGILTLRRNPLSGKRRRNVKAAFFNAGQLTIGGALSAAVLYAFAPGHTAPLALDRPPVILAIVAAALMMYLVNSVLVATMVALQLRLRPADVWVSGRRLDSAQFAGLFLLGVLAAMVASRYPLGVVLITLPATMLHTSMRRMLQMLEQTTSAVEAMADVVDRRDHYTAGHSQRVSEQSVRIARRMGLDRDQIEVIRLAARVHDLGKVGVPEHVLQKNGPLSADEWALMRSHVDLGYEILSRFPEYHRGSELVLAHHERVDGGGYPRGLKGHEMPIGAQIIAVSDALDAMTSDRPYRTKMPLDVALAELSRGKGVQWSTQAVDALEKVLMQEVWTAVGSGAIQSA